MGCGRKNSVPDIDGREYIFPGVAGVVSLDGLSRYSSDREIRRFGHVQLSGTSLVKEALIEYPRQRWLWVEGIAIRPVTLDNMQSIAKQSLVASLAQLPRWRCGLNGKRAYSTEKELPGFSFNWRN